jgi:hypothetical protein
VPYIPKIIYICTYSLLLGEYIREKPRNPYKERQARNLARVRCAPVQVHYYEGCRKRAGWSIKLYRKEGKSYSAMGVFMRFLAIETPSSTVVSMYGQFNLEQLGPSCKPSNLNNKFIYCIYPSCNKCRPINSKILGSRNSFCSIFVC